LGDFKKPLKSTTFIQKTYDLDKMYSSFLAQISSKGDRVAGTKEKPLLSTNFMKKSYSWRKKQKPLEGTNFIQKRN
jgi:hypothetical protein